MAETDRPVREEEFYYLLTEGSELLQAGKVDDARQHFERALEMNPAHEQALNLLGLSLFRLNHLDRAREIFADLVYNNPIEPSLRLNLAMVHLKTGKLDDAKAELEHVLELNPDHPRATSYMGLVLERQGDLDRAAVFYEKAGNKKRAAEIRAYRPTATGTFPLPNLQQMMQAARDQAVRDDAISPPAASIPPTAAGTAPSTAAPPRVPTPATTRASTPPSSSSESSGAQAAALTAATAAQLKRATEPPAASAVETVRGASLGFTLEVDEKKKAAAAAGGSGATPAAPAPPPTAPPTAAAGMPTGVGKPVGESTLPDLVAAAVQADVPTLRDDGLLAFPVPDVGYVRTDLLVALAGQFEIETVNRRYRGKRTDSLFGGPEAAIVALLGRGLALLHPEKLALRVVSLKSEELYLVEAALLAFSQGLVWENGRLPSETDRDLDIVHLRGSGRVVLGTKTPLLALQARPDHPVTVHASRLIGWNGQLVPYRAPLPGLPDVARRIPVVRFEGTGVVLAI